MVAWSRFVPFTAMAALLWFPAGAALADAPPQPWTLPQPRALECLGIRTGGWLQQGITFNSRNPADGFNGPIATNDWDGEYQMNQLWLYFARPTDTGGYGWDWGGHFDMTYGTDWRYGVTYGLEDRINGPGQSYGLLFPQAYLEVAYGDLTIRGGKFAGILGYEVVPAVLNPFYSHSYAMSYTEPLLVTGLMADYRLTEQWLLRAGFHRGWMMWEDINDSLDFMGGLHYTSYSGRTSLAYAVSIGPQDPAGDRNRFASSLVWRRKFTDRFEYILQHNLGVEDGTAAGGGQAEWYGINQYLLYTINPKWSAGLRMEWLRDAHGTRVWGVGNMPWAQGRAWEGGTPSPFGNSFAGDFYALTAGVQWRPSPNWVVRPEVRWDWYDGPRDPENDEFPFNAGESRDQMTFAVDAILTY